MEEFDENVLKTNNYKEEAISLISFEDKENTIKLNDEALEIIRSIQDEIIVVFIVGKQNTGKSYLMNMLLDNSEGVKIYHLYNIIV